MVFEMGKKVSAIIGGLLIDGTGKEALRDGVVLLEGDRIRARATMAFLRR